WNAGLGPEEQEIERELREVAQTYGLDVLLQRRKLGRSLSDSNVADCTAEEDVRIHLAQDDALLVNAISAKIMAHLGHSAPPQGLKSQNRAVTNWAAALKATSQSQNSAEDERLAAALRIMSQQSLDSLATVRETSPKQTEALRARLPTTSEPQRSKAIDLDALVSLPMKHAKGSLVVSALASPREAQRGIQILPACYEIRERSSDGPCEESDLKQLKVESTFPLQNGEGHECPPENRLQGILRQAEGEDGRLE
ncbi:hypothetical protein CYMTET_46305, partial [Cymbomonas tetramitiformis]